MIKLYGIKNCDSVKKALNWFKQNHIEYEFIDFRENRIDKNLLSSWIEKLGLEVILNKRSTNWRLLDDSTKNNINAKNSVDLLSDTPTLIKRPVVTFKDKILVGFDATKYKELLN